jgi:anti-anti-sigma factor
VSNEDRTDWTIMSMAGEVDYAVVPELGEHLRKAVADGRRSIILDLTDVAFCDSTGIGALVSARRLLRSCSGRLRLVMPSSDEHRVNRVFTSLGLRRLFDVHPSVEEALAAADPDESHEAAAG